MAEYDRSRRRVYWVPMRWVWDELALSGRRSPQVLRLPVLQGVPEGAHVEQVIVNHEAKTFDFCVTHPDFGPVPEGECAPRFGTRSGEAVELFTDEDRPLVRHLERELSRLRGLFADLRMDSPPVDEAYRRGLSDAAAFLRKSGESGEDFGVRIDHDTRVVLARALERMAQAEVTP